MFWWRCGKIFSKLVGQPIFPVYEAPVVLIICVSQEKDHIQSSAPKSMFKKINK
jgi:hypothetical protein